MFHLKVTSDPILRNDYTVSPSPNMLHFSINNIDCIMENNREIAKDAMKERGNLLRYFLPQPFVSKTGK